MMFCPPSEHAPISPSRLQRIIDCPGSYRLARGIEEGQSSSYAQEGSHLHAAVETHLNLYKERAFIIPVASDVVNPELDREQTGVVQDCVDYLAQVIRPLNNPRIQVEEKVYLKMFHSVLYDCYGICDIIIRSAKEVHVIDWKFGKGVLVYVHNNDQLMAYLVGTIGTMEDLFDEQQPDRTFHLHVVQPRLDNYDSEELTAKDIDQWIFSRLVPGITKAYEKHANFHPGQKQCRWCPAKNQCRARFNAANQTAADVFKAHAGLPDAVSLEEISKILQEAKIYEDYIKDLRVFVQRELEKGKDVPGWKMVHGRSARRWALEEDKVVENLVSLGFDFSELYTSKFITPPQAEKLDRKLKKDENFQALIVKSEGKPTLTTENDKRKPISYKSVSEIFKEVLEK